MLLLLLVSTRAVPSPHARVAARLRVAGPMHRHRTPSQTNHIYRCHIRRPQMFLDSAVSTLVSGGMMARPSSIQGSLQDASGQHHNRMLRAHAEALLMSPLPVLTHILRQQALPARWAAAAAASVLVRGAALSAEAADNLLDLSMSEPVGEDVAMSHIDGSLALEGGVDELVPSATMMALMAAAALLHLRAH